MADEDRNWATYATVREILEELAHRCKTHLYTNHIAFTLADVCEDFLKNLPPAILEMRGTDPSYLVGDILAELDQRDG